MGKDSFLLRGEWMEAIAALDDADAGKLLKAVYEYNIAGEDPQDLSPMARLVFLMARSFFDDNNEKYRRVCDRNRSNGSGGGRPAKKDETEKNPKNPVGYLGSCEKPKKPSGDEYEYEYDYDSDSDYDPSVPEGGEKRACARENAPSSESKKTKPVKKPVEKPEPTEVDGVDLDDNARNRYLPHNVNLTYTQTEELQRRFPARWYDMIQHLAKYMSQQGKTYADHMKVILDWAAEDGEIEGKERPPYLNAPEEESEIIKDMAFRKGVISKYLAHREEDAAT